MNKEHIGIIIPGLGNGNKWLEWSVQRMSNSQFKGVIFDAEWKVGEKKLKVANLSEKVKYYRDKGHNVSLIGTSAGGSLALCVLHSLKDEVTAGIAISACLRIPENPSGRIASNFIRYPAHKETVALFESIEPDLTTNERKRILTLRPLWDRVVPIETTTVDGATNKRLMIGEHVPSIAAGLTIYSKTIINFIHNIE